MAFNFYYNITLIVSMAFASACVVSVSGCPPHAFCNPDGIQA